MSEHSTHRGEVQGQSSRHTPGPWRVSDESPHIIMCGVSRLVGSVTCWPGTWAYVESEDEAKANARLFAAAPDLLAALLDARCYVQHHVDQKDIDAESLAVYKHDLAVIDAALLKAGVTL